MLPPMRTQANVGTAVAQVASRSNNVDEGTQRRTAAPVVERTTVTESPDRTDVATQAAQTQAPEVLEAEHAGGPMISLDRLESILKQTKRGLKTATLSDATGEGAADWDPSGLGSGKPVVLEKRVTLTGASLAARMLGGKK